MPFLAKKPIPFGYQLSPLGVVAPVAGTFAGRLPFQGCVREDTTCMTNFDLVCGPRNARGSSTDICQGRRGWFASGTENAQMSARTLGWFLGAVR